MVAFSANGVNLAHIEQNTYPCEEMVLDHCVCGLLFQHSDSGHDAILFLIANLTDVLLEGPSLTWANKSPSKAKDCQDQLCHLIAPMKEISGLGEI